MRRLKDAEWAFLKSGHLRHTESGQALVLIHPRRNGRRRFLVHRHLCTSLSRTRFDNILRRDNLSSRN
ncbi:MAG: hypothetical protein M3Q89_01465, partial [Verrucomicrobiota bacterium]|nr:hypothetical protein [Verrucomicrobiota bacterium]